MKILWFVPLTVDKVFQFTSKNELARALSQQGHEIETVVAYRKAKVLLDGFSAVKYVYTPEGSIFAKLRFHFRMLIAAWKTDSVAVMFGFQSAHLIPLAKLCSIWRKCPVFVMDIRTIPVDLQPGLKGKLDQLRYLFAIQIADHFCDGLTVITPMLGETVRPKLKRLKNNMGVWTSGVDLDHFSREGEDMKESLALQGKKILIHHGTLSPNRGLQSVVKSLPLLVKDIPNLLFLVIGDGEGRVELEKLAETLGVQNYVMFTGKVAYADIPKYVRTADVAILPFPDITWWAVSSPIKMMEYLSIGLPVIATEIAAHQWVAEKTGGILLAEDSKPETLAAAILTVMSVKYRHVPVSRELLQAKISWFSQVEELLDFISSLGEKK